MRTRNGTAPSRLSVRQSFPSQRPRNARGTPVGPCPRAWGVCPLSRPDADVVFPGRSDGRRGWDRRRPVGLGGGGERRSSKCRRCPRRCGAASARTSLSTGHSVRRSYTGRPRGPPGGQEGRPVGTRGPFASERLTSASKTTSAFRWVRASVRLAPTTSP